MTRSMQSYVDALEQTTRSLVAVVEGLRPEQWQLPTECPGWTVRDQVAHVVALERQLVGERLPPAQESYGDHVRSDSARHMEDGVVALKGLPTDELVRALRDSTQRHLATLRESDLEPDTMIQGVLGNEVPAARALPVRVFDVWAHEQDVRRAVGVPGNLAGAAAGVSRDQVALALPDVIGRPWRRPPGRGSPST